MTETNIKRNEQNYGIRSWITASAGIADFVNALRTRQRTLRSENNLESYHEYHSFGKIDYEDLIKASEHFDLQVVMTADEYMLAIPKLDYKYDLENIDHSTRLFLFIDRTYAKKTSIKFEGNKKAVKEAVDFMKTKFPFVASSMVSIFNNGDGLSTKNYTLDSSDVRLPHDSFYPFLDGESLHSYYDRFIKSPNKVLILLGEKGMGKTTFIRGLMTYTKKKFGVCSDASIMASLPAKIFEKFEEEETEINVFEDADILLAPRKEMNFSMSTILNVADGLIPQQEVAKMIFTSNLSDVSQIDDALTRHGRAFDIVRFDMYTPEEAKKVGHDIGFDDFEPEQNKLYRLGEIVAIRDDKEHYKERQTNQYGKSKLGFV